MFVQLCRGTHTLWRVNWTCVRTYGVSRKPLALSLHPPLLSAVVALHRHPRSGVRTTFPPFSAASLVPQLRNPIQIP